MKRRTTLVPAVTTSAATYYTVPVNTRAKLVMFHAAHTASSSTTIINLSIKVGSDVTPIVLAETLAVGGSATYFSDNQPVMLESGTLLIAHADNVNCSLIITVEEDTSIASTF